jgi:hypothetical protein
MDKKNVQFFLFYKYGTECEAGNGVFMALLKNYPPLKKFFAFLDFKGRKFSIFIVTLEIKPIIMQKRVLL